MQLFKLVRFPKPDKFLFLQKKQLKNYYSLKNIYFWQFYPKFSLFSV